LYVSDTTRKEPVVNDTVLLINPTFGGHCDIPDDGWSLFHSPGIEALVTQALKANPDVATASAQRFFP
jgi:outer membrane protein TolC